MQVRILGPVDVTVDGAARAVRGLRRKAVLAVLALHAAEIVSIDRLIEAVWGEKAPVTAANTLQSHVSHLRGVLGGRTAIEARSPGYVLDLGADGTDLQVAQRLIRQGKESMDPVTSASCLRAALALWRDQPLVDVAGLAGLDGHAERLAEIHLEAVEALIEARLALGEHARLVTELERLCRQYPFREHVHGQLMLALYRTGRQVDALAVYRRLGQTLDEELGIDPSPALRDLHAAVLRQDAALDSPGAELAAESGVLDRDPLSHIQFCKTQSGVRIAYTRMGQGPALVVPAAWIAHLEFAGQDPALRAFYAPLLAHRTVVQYDGPGSGLSDPWPENQSLDTELEVLTAVVDELELDRFALLGVSMGSPVALAFAARHPDRVDQLILYGGYADGQRIASAEVRSALLDLVRANWGLGSDMLADIFLPDADAAARERFIRLQRASTSADAAGRLLARCYEYRVTDLLDQVAVPTLVLHRRADRAIPYALGRELAARIPGARFVTLEGRSHFPYVGDSQAIVHAVLEFLAATG